MHPRPIVGSLIALGGLDPGLRQRQQRHAPGEGQQDQQRRQVREHIENVLQRRGGASR